VISICVPTVGRPEKLFEAVCSILLQGEKDIELILWEDDPGKLIKESDPVYGLLKYLRTDRVSGEHLGLFRGLNNCLSRSRGNLIYFLGDDDLLCPGALRTVREHFDNDRFGGPGWVYGKTISADEHGRTLGIDGGYATYEMMLEHNRIGGPSVFWNRGMLDIAGTFDTRYRYAADYDMWLRFWKVAEPAFIDQTLGIYRHHAGQTSVTRAEQLEREAVKISERHRGMGSFISGTRRLFNARKFFPPGGPVAER